MNTQNRDALFALDQCGQSIWLDYISRELLTSGKLKRLIAEDHLKGMTSNPTIFQQAIGASADYDEQFRSLVEQGKSVDDVYLSLTTTDIRNALDVFQGVYEQTNHVDGRVSIEVTPDVALDCEQTLDQARRLWQIVDRPNLLVKIPATKEGLPAIEQAIASGISVNITLLFSVDRYDEVMEAYLTGLEHRVKKGQPIREIFSVASFFVSRVDTMVDKMLQQKIAQTSDPEQKRRLEGLLGKAAIANAKIAYQHYQQIFGSERFQRLQPHGANLQRPLWASTSTKNPAYRDVVYVEELIGPHTVNTMPENTLVAMKDHGVIRGNTVQEDLTGAQRTLQELAEVGIDIREVTLVKLVDEGVKKFADSYDELMTAIREKHRTFLAEGRVSVPG